MGKKAKKNRFNKTVDVEVVYSSNTIAEVDPTDTMAELNLSKEKAEELQKIRAKLPTFSQTTLLENELTKLPTEKPFRAFVHNMAFSASETDVSEFFTPLSITNINLVCGENGSRGFCFVDFATRDDLAKALERNDSTMAGRPVNVRIADPNSNDRGYGRDRNSFGGGMSRGGGGRYDRRQGGYRPAALRDEYPDSGDFGGGGGGEWRRGTQVSRPTDSRPSFGPSFTGRSGGDFGSRGFGPAPTSGLSFDSGPPRLSERPKLNIQPRSSNVVKSKSGSEPVRDPKIFGAAKPVDTASKDLEIEQRLHSQSSSAAAPAAAAAAVYD